MLVTGNLVVKANDYLLNICFHGNACGLHEEAVCSKVGGQVSMHSGIAQANRLYQSGYVCSQCCGVQVNAAVCIEITQLVQ